MENDDMNMMSGEVNASTLLDFFNQLTSKSSSSLESLPIKVVQPWSSSPNICIFWIHVVPIYLKLCVRKWKTLPTSLPEFLFGFSGLFQNFSKITDSMATPIPKDSTTKAVKMLSKAISLKALSSQTISEYLKFE